MGSGPDAAAQAGGQWPGLSYRRQFTLIGLITLATVVAATVSFTWLQRQMVAASGETIAIMAAEIAAKLDILLNERAGDIHILSETMGMSGGTSSSRQHILRAFHQAYPLYSWIGVTDATGRITEATNPATLGFDIHRNDWFRAAQYGGGASYIGDIAYDEVTNGLEAVSFTAPIVDHRTVVTKRPFRGVVSTRVAAPRLEELVTDAIQLFQKRTSFFHTAMREIALLRFAPT